MLDAAHGEGVRPIGVVERVHGTRIEVQVARVVMACVVGRRRPDVAVRAYIRQGSRRVEAVARSRRWSNRWDECRKETEGFPADWDAKLAAHLKRFNTWGGDREANAMLKRFSAPCSLPTGARRQRIAESMRPN